MGKALQCPECGARHPLDELRGVRTFRCGSCRRLLKVPEEVQVGAVSGAGAGAGTAPSASGRTEMATGGSAARGAGAEEQAATETAPSVGADGRRIPPSERGVDLRAHEAERRRAPSSPSTTRTPPSDRARARVPRPLRLFIWILAIPLGAVPVLLLGRASGVITIDTVMDTFVAEGWRRYLLPLVVLPSWAAVTATLVHVAVEGLGRLLARPPGDG